MEDDDNDEIKWYQARFLNKNIPQRAAKGRGKNKLPRWIKKGQVRPIWVRDAVECIPEGLSIDNPLSAGNISPLEAEIITNTAKGVEKTEHALLFDSVDTALRMEAAFWLERQFCSWTGGATRHWYNYTFQEMIQILSEKRTPPPS